MSTSKHSESMSPHEFKRSHYLALAMACVLVVVALYFGGEAGLFRDKRIFPDSYMSERAVGEWHYVVGDDGHEFARNRSMPQIDAVKTSFIPSADFLFLNMSRSFSSGDIEFTLTSQNGINYCGVAIGCELVMQLNDGPPQTIKASVDDNGAIRIDDSKRLDDLLNNSRWLRFNMKAGDAITSFSFDLNPYPKI